MGWKDDPVAGADYYPPGDSRNSPAAVTVAGGGPAWERDPVVQSGPSVMDYAADVARVVPGGLAQAAAAIAGAPGDIESLLDAGGNWIAKKLGASDETLDRIKQYRERSDAAGLMPKLPTSAGINKAVSDPFGGYYKPKTIAGEYAQTAAQFAPAALSPGAAGRRIARTLVPAATSETAGQLTKGTEYEPYARAVGALVGGIGVGIGEGVVSSNAARNAAPTTTDIRTAANNIYTNAKNAGVEISAPAYTNLSDDIAATLKAEGFHPKLHPKIDGVLDSLGEVKGKTVQLGELERLRRVAGIAARSIDADERRIASIALDKIDDFMDNLSPQQTTSGNPAVAGTLSEARSLWAKLKKSDKIDELIERAKNRATTQNGNYAASLRAEFQALLKNKKALRGFTKEEITAIKKVARLGPGTGTLAAFGAMRPRGLVGAIQGTVGATGAMYSGDIMTALPSVAIAGVGQGSQMGLNAMTARRASLAEAMMRQGPGGMSAAQSGPSVVNAPLMGLLSQARP